MSSTGVLRISEARGRAASRRPFAEGPTLFDQGAPERVDRAFPDGRPSASRYTEAASPHDALLALDIETVVDTDLLPVDWPADRFPKAAWHKVVAISFVEAAIVRDPCDGTERFRIRCCRSGGEPGWSEERLLRAFWKHFEGGRFRIVSWNGRNFDIPTLLMRSLRHGIAAPAWFLRGTKWAGYGYRQAVDWHADVMEALSHFGASSKLTLDEGAALIGLPGKLGEHGSHVAALIEAGEIGRVRDYCETDTLNLVVLYYRWAYLTGRINADAHDGAVADLMSYLKQEGFGRPHLARFLDAWILASNDRSAFVGSEARKRGVAGVLAALDSGADCVTH
jgi:predicted PolB exonuclease-like 3'-5' exonuclease